LCPRPLRVFELRSRRKPELAGPKGVGRRFRRRLPRRPVALGSAYPFRFRNRRLPPGSTPVSSYRPFRRFHSFRPAAVPNRMAFTFDCPGIASTVGFHHRAGISRPRVGLTRLAQLDFPRRVCIAAFRPGTLRRWLAFAFLQLGRSARRLLRVARTVGPAFRGGFRFHFRRIASNLRSGRTAPPDGTALRRMPSRATMEQETLRLSPVGSRPVPGSKPPVPFGTAGWAITG